MTSNISDLGLEIHRCYDEFGPIRVFENGALRYLAFGETAEQSCVNLLHPSKLVYEYTQAMMLALLYLPKPKQVTFLGLGAGSLVHALHHYDQNLDIKVVELRAKVVEVAQEWFALDVFPELTLKIGDAAEYIAHKHPLSDLIFADIYNLCIFWKTPSRCGTQIHSNWRLNFVLSSHRHLIGDQNDGHYL